MPNAAGWSARRFGASWLAYDVPKHLFHFSPATLKTLAQHAGLTCVAENHFSLEYSPVTFLQSVLSASFGGDGALFRRLTSEGTPGGAEVSVTRGELEPAAAVLMAVPALLVSGVLSRWHAGDTYGAYFERRS